MGKTKQEPNHDYIGRYAVIPATIPDKGTTTLKLDLIDPWCLRFEVADVHFVVDRVGLQTMLKAYDEFDSLVPQEGRRIAAQTAKELVEGPRSAPIVTKSRIGWWVDGRWCPNVKIRDYAIARSDQGPS